MSVMYQCPLCGVKYPYDHRLSGRPLHKHTDRLGKDAVHEMREVDVDELR